MARISDDALRGIRQCRALEDRILNGTIDARDIRDDLQALIEKRSIHSTRPPWYDLSLNEQLERVRQLNELRNWGFRERDFPFIPSTFRARTTSEALMLCAYLPSNRGHKGLPRTYTELWQLIEAPTGCTKRCLHEPDVASLQLLGGRPHVPGIRWVAFDSKALQVTPPRFATEVAAETGCYAAGIEVLMAAVLFPEYVLGFGSTSPYPHLSGLQFGEDGHVPRLRLSVDATLLELEKVWNGHMQMGWSSPTVREC